MTLADGEAGTGSSPPRRAPPRLRGGLPVLGHVTALGRNPVDFLTRVRRECGDVAAFKILGQKMVLFSGPRAQEVFFHAPDSTFSPKDAYQKMMAPVFGAGVVYDAPTAEVMAEQIGLVFPALHEKRLRSYLQEIVRETESGIADWGDVGAVDVLDFAKEVTLRAASSTLLGPEIRSRLSTDFAPSYRDLERGITPVAFVFPRLPIPTFRRRDAALQRLQVTFSGIVAQRRQHGSHGEDFLQTLMDTQYSDGRALSDHEITGLLIAMLFAGHHTSAATLAWTVLELLDQPRLLPPLRAELDHAVADGKPIGCDALKKTPLLDALVSETLRLHPPLPMLMRKVVTDVEYHGYLVAAGCFAIASPTVSHHLSEVFPEPERFEPARYRPDRAEDRNRSAYIPFGGGHHRCPGMRFGVLQVKAILTVLLQHYEMALDQPKPEPDFRAMVVVPQRPCRIRYRRRAATTDVATPTPRA